MQTIRILVLLTLLGLALFYTIANASINSRSEINYDDPNLKSFRTKPGDEPGMVQESESWPWFRIHPSEVLDGQRISKDKQIR